MGSLSVDTSKLPAADAPTLKLILATPEQVWECQEANGQSWRGPLSLEAYHRREEHLANQPLTRHGGISCWVLVDSAAATPVVLAACETYRKRAFVARRKTEMSSGSLAEITSHGIGSVFCREELRGRGYAGRMMEELAVKLQTWQQEAGAQALFNVLYSDIGKKFYARRGWKPFLSSHISLQPKALPASGDLPRTRPLLAKDLGELCKVDEAQLGKSMVDFANSSARVRVAYVPEFDLIQWMHAREDFVIGEVLGQSPDIKGAIVDGEPGQRVWAIFSRVILGKGPGHGNKLHISRLVVEDAPVFQADIVTSGANSVAGSSGSEARVAAIAACIRAAQEEASKWGVDSVDIWNPAPETLKAARRLSTEVEVVHRDEESIASLLWYGSEITPEELEWVGNEKYGWC